MFINALSWKKFNTSKKKSADSSNKNKGSGLAFRPPLDNIHPLVDNNRNIQNALCHGSKSTSLAEAKRNLDIVRSSSTGTAGTGGEVRKNSNLVGSKTQQSAALLTSQKVGSISHSNSLNNNTVEQPLKSQQTRREKDNEEIVKKRQSTANKLEPLAVKPGPKKTVIQVSLDLAEAPGRLKVRSYKLPKLLFSPP